MPDINEELTIQERAASLYRYLMELSRMKQRSIVSVEDYQWKMYVSELLQDSENIEVFYRDRVDEEETETEIDPALVRIHKPEFQACPKPVESFSAWLEPGWEDFHNEADVTKEKTTNLNNVLRFEDNAQRAGDYEDWLERRTEWQEKQYTTEKTRILFQSLYQTYNNVNRESETMEIVVADGFLLDRDDLRIKHPLITRRVAVSFEPAANTLQLEDLDVNSELYSLIVREIEALDSNSVSSITDALHESDFHPLDRIETPEFLKASIHKLSSDSLFSKEGIPEDWSLRNRFLVYSDPVFIYRKRVDGTPRFIGNIIENIEESDNVPAPIAEIVKGGKIEVPERDHELTIEEQLAAVGGEDVDILLSKEANKEQLEIAQRIERYNGVLVQGPPGTGKTHTIANLLGHFLAKGKSVLVTSQTPKALQVLKDKLPDNIKPLCVSVLNDKNVDMVRSVDGITSFMAQNTASELIKAAALLKEERENVIKALGEVRKKIFAIIRAESEPLIINGEEVSPSKAADFVFSNQETLSYIPGKVVVGEKLPLSYNELIDLYHSNAIIDGGDEKELDCDLPDPKLLPAPSEFADAVSNYNQVIYKRDGVIQKYNWSCTGITGDRIRIDLGNKELDVTIPEKDRIEELADFMKSFEEMEDWMKYAAIDGQRGGAYAERWKRLIATIEEACQEREKLVEATFGKDVSFEDIEYLLDNEAVFNKIYECFIRNGRITMIDRIANHGIAPALSMVKVNGEEPQNAGDANAIFHTILMEKQLRLCTKFWDELIGKRGAKHFLELDEFEPEQVARQWIPSIKSSLTWYDSALNEVDSNLEVIGIHTKDVIRVSKEDSALQVTEKIITAMTEILPAIVSIVRAEEITAVQNNEWIKTCNVLKEGKRIHSGVCRSLAEAIEKGDADLYKTEYTVLADVYEKYHLLKIRQEALEKIALVAPDWAEAIKARKDIHGDNSVPLDIADAWKWKQYNGKLSEILSSSYDELQKESAALSKRYREVTGEYAEKMAWYHLLSRTECDLDMRQDLNAWKLTVRKIGKGTGKNAPKLKAEAQKLMASCQNAVPAWVMPMSRVIESLDPRANQFDVVIVDEASQSDVTALGILYLGKKVVVVGDDQQVSPMAIGAKTQQQEALSNMYISGRINISHLYDAKTSLYDIAATTYQRLMLREHFRCVPAIIGFSNGLSYDYKIKPLRDAGSSTLLPAVVSYKVDGERQYKKNPVEAQAIVALIKACLKQKEYENKTFGVISLLGDDQAKLISSLIFRHIPPQDIEKHQILCGNPSHFQGDERDVIFLSVVDSPNERGPLSKQEFGSDESTRKRYNVAASRAKDQLWVVYSLDPANDLKPGDIRKRLIEYSIDPVAFDELHRQVEARADSPFEAAVVEALQLKGYELKQQMPVGAYKLDIVAMDGRKQVAIECDGERYHSGEMKIREDMERQTILERSGWRFIRIRGSEYYRNPKATIERVEKELHAFGIEPSLNMELKAGPEEELLSRVKAEAKQILDNLNESGTNSLIAISAALDYKDAANGHTLSSDENEQAADDFENDKYERSFVTAPETVLDAYQMCSKCYWINNGCNGEPYMSRCRMFQEK